MRFSMEIEFVTIRKTFAINTEERDFSISDN